MQFDDKTLTILKNFNSINQSILIKPGSSITTMATNKTLLATAKLDIEFNSQFGIYDLSKFLGVLSLFEKPDLTIGEKYATIKNGSKKVNYVFADPETLNVPKVTEIELKDVVVDAKISKSTLSDILKASAVLGLPKIAVAINENGVKLKALDTKNPTGDVYEIELNRDDVITVNDTKVFNFKTENFKFIQQDYNLKIDTRGIALFSSENDILRYWLTVETN